ncbi:uncharacterized protein DUF4296 [Pontibacter mucosus]|uniref:Uncharacterized protein DUF4296 n=1 Tax=Pontibacter mucosus TaxID=1649266 RepID=A0A2T5YM05_9BACT|nr:DUF4296 domain-containing protein [Pontibacter mucosus]PTX20349.1 uncharacterized protein DUF4296 [Pontibacter mucosus]
MKRLFCILSCLCLLSCQSQSSDTPKDLVPREKMVRILADIHTREAVIETNIAYTDTALMAYNKEQEKILQHYNVTQQQFKETYNYYLNNLPQMDALYEIVVDTLSAREAKAQAEAGRPQEVRPQGDKQGLRVLE